MRNEYPIEAVATLSSKPLFDFKKEVQAAKPESDKLLETMKPVCTVVLKKPVVTAEPDTKRVSKESFSSLKIIGLQFSRKTENQFVPFNRMNDGIYMYLLGELSTPGLIFHNATIDSATNSDGENLLENRDLREKRTNIGLLTVDRKKIVFEVGMNMPHNEIKELKELSGSVNYFVGKGQKTIDVGINEFKKDAKGNVYDIRIDSIQDNSFEKDLQFMHLSYSIPNDQILDATFYNESGKVFPAQECGSSNWEERYSRSYSSKGKFPEKGSVKFTVYEDFKEYKIPFKMKNVPLQFQPEGTK